MQMPTPTSQMIYLIDTSKGTSKKMARKSCRSAKFNTGWSKESFFRVRLEIGVMALRTAICSKKENPTWRSTRPGLDDVEGRLKDLDKEGIDIQVAYPNIMAMASHLDNGDLAAAMCRAYNNYTAEKCQAFDGRVTRYRGRASSEATGSGQRITKSDQGSRTCRERWLRELSASRNLDDPYFDPFFREANELGAASRGSLDHWLL